MFAAGQARAAAYQAAYQAGPLWHEGQAFRRRACANVQQSMHSTGVRDVTSHVPCQLFLSAAVDFEKMARVPTCPMRLKKQIFAFIGS